MGLKAHFSVHTPDAFLCQICGKSFRCIQAHMKLHTEREPLSLECAECGNVLTSQRSLFHHMRTYHGGVVECNLCGKTCANPAKLKVHMTVVHTRPSKHVCTVCGKAFHFNNKLKVSDCDLSGIMHNRDTHANAMRILCRSTCPRTRMRPIGCANNVRPRSVEAMHCRIIDDKCIRTCIRSRSENSAARDANEGKHIGIFNAPVVANVDIL